jgi:hypothetical protein
MFLILIKYKDFNLFFQTFRKFGLTKVHLIAQICLGYWKRCRSSIHKEPRLRIRAKKNIGRAQTQWHDSIIHFPSPLFSSLIVHSRCRSLCDPLLPSCGQLGLLCIKAIPSAPCSTYGVEPELRCSMAHAHMLLSSSGRSRMLISVCKYLH